ERLEAMRAAAHLDIPFVTLDLEKEYKEGVIDYMIHEYSLGRTPNPDVMCNREVKFGAFWKWAREHGADYIATGHYAINKKVGGESRLLAGVDKNKDQSYFLWTLKQEDLEHVLFPVGHLQKSEVRELARRFGLPNAEKKDSQGLCFMGKVDVKEFLKHYIKVQSGDVVNEKKERIGHHPGALLFTIGERRGFTITEKTPDDKPYYVIGKDISTNRITVTNKGEPIYIDDARQELSGRDMSNGQKSLLTVAKISNVNWVGRIPGPDEELWARSRYRAPLYKCIVTSNKDGVVLVRFTEKQETLTPGQSLVLYDGDECLGGGILI
ncbi:MAG: tRNA 2-thiouridine(34) synthase MnmA, partial [Candidatus Taylorbacteria bacterium]|nr:tRNA 2-thiouridine(34) synthase MnmA [Candidatus Taylorbacteria bacterium]